MSNYYARTLQTIPGRDAKPAQTMDRIAWLKRYLAERAAFSWTAEYQARLAELAMLEARLNKKAPGCTPAPYPQGAIL